MNVTKRNTRRNPLSGIHEIFACRIQHPGNFSLALGTGVDCKAVAFFSSKSVKKSVKRGVRVLRARASHAKSVSPQSRSLFSASFQTFCLTAHAYLNTQKYGLFCSKEGSMTSCFTENVTLCQLFPILIMRTFKHTNEINNI